MSTVRVVSAEHVRAFVRELQAAFEIDGFVKLESTVYQIMEEKVSVNGDRHHTSIEAQNEVLTERINDGWVYKHPGAHCFLRAMVDGLSYEWTMLKLGKESELQPRREIIDLRLIGAPHD